MLALKAGSLAGIKGPKKIEMDGMHVL